MQALVAQLLWWPQSHLHVGWWWLRARQCCMRRESKQARLRLSCLEALLLLELVALLTNHLGLKLVHCHGTLQPSTAFASKGCPFQLIPWLFVITLLLSKLQTSVLLLTAIFRGPACCCSCWKTGWGAMGTACCEYRPGCWG